MIRFPHHKEEYKMTANCPKCTSTTLIKNGYVFGWQRYKCKKCGYQFTKEGGKGKPLNLILTCHGLFTFGLSMHQIARIIGVSVSTISRWIKKWHQTYLTDIGNNEIIYKTNLENLKDCINIDPKEPLMLSSTKLPSGAEIHVLIKLPN